MTGRDKTGDDTDTTTLSLHHPQRVGNMMSDLESYWRSLRGARRLPVRTDVDPAQIDAALPLSFILERVAPEVGRLRVAGHKLNDYIGMEARGLPLSAFFLPEARDILGAHLARLFDTPALVDLPILGPRGLGRPRLTGRLLLLPLTDRDGSVTRALGAILTDGMLGRGPRRFAIPEDGRIRVEPIEVPAQPVGLAAVSGSLARALQTPGPQKRPDAARPALRLVVSNG